MQAMDQVPTRANATVNNSKLFPFYEQQLSAHDAPTFDNFARKLAKWLSNNRAYYPEARPQIVHLLHTAYNNLCQATDTKPGTSFHVSAHMHHPMVPPYIELMAAVYPFYRVFEPGLLEQVAALLSTAGLTIIRDSTQAHYPSAIYHIQGDIHQPQFPTTTSTHPGMHLDSHPPPASMPPSMTQSPSSTHSLPSNQPPSDFQALPNFQPPFKSNSTRAKKKKRKVDLTQLVELDLNTLQGRENESKGANNADGNHAETIHPPVIDLTVDDVLESPADAERDVNAYPKLTSMKPEVGIIDSPSEQQSPVEENNPPTAMEVDIPSTNEDHPMEEHVDYPQNSRIVAKTAETVGSSIQYVPVGLSQKQESIGYEHKDQELQTPVGVNNPLEESSEMQLKNIIKLEDKGCRVETTEEDAQTSSRSPDELILAFPELQPPQAVTRLNAAKSPEIMKMEEIVEVTIDPKPQKFVGGMRVLAVEQCLPKRKIVMQLDISQTEYDQLHAWAQLAKASPLPSEQQCLVLSLGCYLRKDLFSLREKIRKESPQIQTEDLIKLFLEESNPSWPDSDDAFSISINPENNPQKMSLSSLFFAMQDGFADLSPFLVRGVNSIELFQQEGISSEHLFALIAHYPTENQLAWLKAQERKRDQWQSWCAQITRPFVVDYSAFERLETLPLEG